MFGKKKKKKWPIVLVSVLAGLALLIVAGCFIGSTLCLQLRLEGDSVVTQGYGEVFTDAGGEAVLTSGLFPNVEIPVPVRVSNLVQSDTVGVYGLVYQADFLWLHATKVRIVQIVDTIPPEITLIEDTVDFILPGSSYVEAGFFAYDEYDGDVSHLVTWQLQGETLIYTVTDSSGNSANAFRVINFDDPIPPQLELKGNVEEIVYMGRTYEESGFTAMDNFDGDLTAKVIVEGFVDTKTQGEYPITYTVTDTFGNTSSLVRTVKVEPVPQPETVVPEGKVVYLTFDDGPSKFTPKLLEILRRYNVKATFFVVNTKYADLLPEIAADGHAIGVHTGSHVYQTIYSSEEAYFQDFKLMYDKVYELTGVQTTLMRFPGGSSNKVSSFNPGIMTRLSKLVTEYGLQYFDWNVDSADASQAKTAKDVFEKVKAGLLRQNCSVVLQHDLYEFSVDAVEMIIQWGLENGYRFLPLEPSSPTCHQTIVN